MKVGGKEEGKEGAQLAHTPSSPDLKLGRVKEQRRYLTPSDLVSESEASRRMWLTSDPEAADRLGRWLRKRVQKSCEHQQRQQMNARLVSAAIFPKLI